MRSLQRPNPTPPFKSPLRKDSSIVKTILNFLNSFIQYIQYTPSL